MKLDAFYYYKETISKLRNFQPRFKLLEGKTSCCGASNIMQLKTLTTELVEHVKDAAAFIKDPFSEAGLDNVIKSGSDVMSACQVAEYEPSTVEFDARDILDLDELDKIVNDAFRCIATIKSLQGLSLPRALITLDLILHDVLTMSYMAFNPSQIPDQSLTLTGKTTVDGQPIIVFNVLPEQKYLNHDEREAIRQQKESEAQAIVDARKKADHQELMFKYLKDLEQIMDADMINKFVKAMPGDIYIVALHDVAMKFFTKDTIMNLFTNGTEIVTRGDVSNAAFANVSRMISNDQRTITFTNPDSYAVIDDTTDQSILPDGTVLRINVE